MSRLLTITDLQDRLATTEDPAARKRLKEFIYLLSDPDPLTVTNDEDAGGLRPIGPAPHLRNEHPRLSFRSIRDRVASIRRRLVGPHLGYDPETRGVRR